MRFIRKAARFAAYKKTKARVSRSSSLGGKERGDLPRTGERTGGGGRGEPLDIDSVLAQTHAYKDVMTCQVLLSVDSLSWI